MGQARPNNGARLKKKKMTAKDAAAGETRLCLGWARVAPLPSLVFCEIRQWRGRRSWAAESDGSRPVVLSLKQATGNQARTSPAQKQTKKKGTSPPPPLPPKKLSFCVVSCAYIAPAPPSPKSAPHGPVPAKLGFPGGRAGSPSPPRPGGLAAPPSRPLLPPPSTPTP